MAFSFIGAASWQLKAASTTTVVTVSSAGDVLAGSLVVAWLAKDNTSTTDGDNAEVTSVTDSKGNVWQKAKELSNGSPGAAAGATISIWFSVLTTTLVNNVDTVTFNHASCTARVAGLNYYTKGVGTEITVAGSNQSEGATTVPSLALSGLAASIEYLFFRASAVEAAASPWTSGTASWDLGGSTSTSGGGGASNMGGSSESIILTATSATSNPATKVASGDNANAIVAFKETVPAKAFPPYDPAFTGARLPQLVR